LNSVNENLARNPEVPSALIEEKAPGATVFANSNASSAVAVCLLIALNAICYFRSINGYFLADDFIHIPWLFNVFHGHPDLLLKNFVSNWMQTDGTQFYRPLISLTMATDYAIWGVNPIGYHLTNLAFQISSTIFLFLACRRMFGGWIAFSAAALFAVSPLHAEVVSWVIARVDSVATTFYLAAFWLFLRTQQGSRPDRNSSDDSVQDQTSVTSVSDSSPLTMTWAVAAFVLSLLAKEIAVTLPAALALYCFLYPTASVDFKSRFRYAAKSTAVYWLVLAIYMVVRTLALGTVSGGYGGSIGAGLSTSVYQRWFGDGSFLRVLFPLNELVFTHADKTRHFLKLLYQVAAGVIAARFALLIAIARSTTAPNAGPDASEAGANQSIRDPLTVIHEPLSVISSESREATAVERSLMPLRSSLKPLAFAAGWFVIVMLPAYQVFNLSTTLQGSRFIYLGTAPICLLIALLLSPLSLMLRQKPNVPSALDLINKAVSAASSFVLILLIGYFAVIAYRNNEPWVHASTGVRALREAIEKQFKNLPPDRSMAVINLPQRYKGAHMIYNGAMFSILVQPPLSAADYSGRIATFEPVMFGDADLLNISRLRRMAGDPQHYSIFYWQESNNELKPIDSSQIESNCDFVLANVELTIDQTAEKSDVKPVLSMTWGSKPMSQQVLYAPLQKRSAPQTVTFCVSEHKSWITDQPALNLRFDIPSAGYSVKILKVSQKSGKDSIPDLQFQPQYLNSTGTHPVEDPRGVTWTGTGIGPFHYDVSRIPGASGAMYELSKRDCWFNHYSAKLRDQEPAPEVTERGYLRSLRGDRTELVPSSQLQQAGYYDFRLFAVDRNNRLVGYASDPVSLWLMPNGAHDKTKGHGQK